MFMWGKRYYAPNPYTKSMSYSQKPVIINNFLVNWVLEHETALWSEALNAMFTDAIGNSDILVNMINNYTEVSISDDVLFLKTTAPKAPYSTIYADVDPKDKKAFFEYFGGINFYGGDNLFERQDKSLQQIFYGAPGTGKSNTIKREVDEKDLPNIRTTFHPDSDYSSFVGAYKPTSIEVPSRDVTGKVIIENGQKVTENRIVYEFVPQAFLKAYTGAWKNQGNPFFLIIEEINRGNCAQIFGDLFQLLDRKNGESEYPISPDEDIQKFLKTDKKFGFAALTEEEKAGIPSEILSGELLKLPKNLYIWATMNTSDQSLFPIDSAFKRRWDWKYIPITEGMENGAPLKWKINVNGKFYDWWQFVVKINDEINEQTKSEDKKLGYFFCKANNGIISADTFVSKVIFYLWNDVFKDQAFGNSIFMDGDDELTFNSFFGNRNGETTIKEEKVEVFLQNLGVVAEGNADEGVTDEIADENAKKQRKEILVSIQIPGNPTILASESSPFESFIKALRIIGLDKVESSLPSLKYKRLDCPVISTQKYDGIANNDKGYSYYKEGNLYIVKGCKSYTYIRILEELDKIYNIGLSMETK